MRRAGLADGAADEAAVTAAMVAEGLDDVHAYDDTPSARYPTLEFRVSDVCLQVDDAVALAGLIRSLAWTCAAQELAGEAAQTPPAELMEAATWRAARYGLDAEVIVSAAGAERLVTEDLTELLNRLEPVAARLHCADDLALVERIPARGASYQRQRAVAAATAQSRNT